MQSTCNQFTHYLRLLRKIKNSKHLVKNFRKDSQIRLIHTHYVLFFF